MILISSNSFSSMALSDVLDAITPHFRGWEITAEGTLRLPDIEKELSEYLASHELLIQIHAPLSDVNIAAASPPVHDAVVKEMVLAMESASNLGVEVMTLHPGFRTPLYRRPEQVRQRTHETLKILSKEANDRGITLALENMPLTFITVGREPWELDEMSESLEIKWCFDVGHANTTGTMDDFLRRKDRFANIHIHDNMGKEDEHLPLGEGNIDWKRVLGALSDYHGNFVLEMERGVPDALKSLEYLDQAFPDLL